jgi:hypothetical protein
LELLCIINALDLRSNVAEMDGRIINFNFLEQHQLNWRTNARLANQEKSECNIRNA